VNSSGRASTTSASRRLSAGRRKLLLRHRGPGRDPKRPVLSVPQLLRRTRPRFTSCRTGMARPRRSERCGFRVHQRRFRGTVPHGKSLGRRQRALCGPPANFAEATPSRPLEERARELAAGANDGDRRHAGCRGRRSDQCGRSIWQVQPVRYLIIEFEREEELTVPGKASTMRVLAKRLRARRRADCPVGRPERAFHDVNARPLPAHRFTQTQRGPGPASRNSTPIPAGRIALLRVTYKYGSAGTKVYQPAS